MGTLIVRLTTPVTYGDWTYPEGSTLRAHRDAEGTYLFTRQVGVARRLRDEEFTEVEASQIG